MSRPPKHTDNPQVVNEGWVSVKTNTSPNRRKRRRKKNKTKSTKHNKSKSISTKPKHAAPPNASTIYCQWFQDGLCQRGANCFFIHELDPLSEKNPIEHKQMIKGLMASSAHHEASSNVQIALKKHTIKQPTLPPIPVPQPAPLLQTHNPAYNNHNNNNINDYRAPAPAPPPPRAPAPNNPYMDAIENLQNYADPKWSEYVSDATSWLHSTADAAYNSNPWTQTMHNAHYNPYLTAENAHTANPYAHSTMMATTNPYFGAENTMNPYVETETKTNALNADDALVNDPSAFNEDDYEVWQDENGEIIVIEKQQMYSDNQYNCNNANTVNTQQRGMRSGGDTYCYGANAHAANAMNSNAMNSNINKQTTHVHNAKPKAAAATAYASVAAKFNDIALNIGRVENPDHNAKAKICHFWLDAQCLYSGHCKMAHRFATNKCPHCNKTVGTSPLIQQHHLRKCPSKIALEAESKISESAECGICREGVLNKGNKFGLLTGCTHCFCLKCIREWRGVLHQSKDSTRSCPICRQITYFIVPSHRFITDPKRKKAIVDQYKQRLAQIRCRHFDENQECPFGTSCFYKHVRKDGTVDDKKHITLRHMINADGDTQIMKQMRLSEFLFGDLSD